MNGEKKAYFYKVYGNMFHASAARIDNVIQNIIQRI